MALGLHRLPFPSFTTALTSTTVTGVNDPALSWRSDDLIRTRDERESHYFGTGCGDDDDDRDPFFHVQLFPFALCCRQRPKVFISDFFPDEEESYVDTDEAEVDVDVHGRSERGASAAQIQQLDAGKLAFLRLPSLMVGLYLLHTVVFIANHLRSSM